MKFYDLLICQSISVIYTSLLCFFFLMRLKESSHFNLLENYFKSLEELTLEHTR